MVDWIRPTISIGLAIISTVKQLQLFTGYDTIGVAIFWKSRYKVFKSRYLQFCMAEDQKYDKRKTHSIDGIERVSV